MAIGLRSGFIGDRLNPMTTLTQTTPTQHRLSPEQVKQFHEEGYLAPLTACSPDEMEAYKAHIESVIMQTEGIGGHDHLHNRHLDDRTLWELSTIPSIVGPMQSVLGENLLMWRTNFFNKEPGGKEIPWHQDRNYWPLEPEIVISAWLAIDRADRENSCVQVIPGTHKQLIKHVRVVEEERSQKVFSEEANVDGIDFGKTRDIILEPGQFILFNERTLHHSNANHSNRRRLGLAIRAIIPQVRVTKFDSDQHLLFQISGEDPMGFNPIGEPPLS